MGVTLPLLKDIYTFSLLSGTSYSTVLTLQVIIEREGFPYGDCREQSKTDYSKNVFQELYPVQYSTTVSKRAVHLGTCKCI